MAINVQRIALIHEKLNFLYFSVRGVHYQLINVLGHFLIVKFTYISSAGKTVRKITETLRSFGFN